MDTHNMDNKEPHPSSPPQDDGIVVLSDASTMRALANQSRMRVLALLRVRGEMNVGEICAQTGFAPGSVSYHLKMLASVGLVEKVEHPEDRRTSWWKPVGWAMSVSTEQSHDDSGATNEYLEAVSHTYHETYVRYLAARDTIPVEWRDASLNEDWVMRMTVEELTAMNAELDAVAQRWYHLTQGREQSDEYRSVALIMQTFPWLP